MIHTRISYNNEARLFEGPGDIVSEGTGGETTGDSLGTGVGGKFEYSAVSVGPSGDDTDIIWVLNSCDDPGSEYKFLPCFPNVQDVNPCDANRTLPFDRICRWSRTVSPPFPDVRLHLLIAVFCANVALGSQKELDLLLAGTQNGW